MWDGSIAGRDGHVEFRGGFDCTVSGTLTLTPASGSVSGILVEEQVHCVDNGTPITVAREQ